jgi:hypothetical protein
LPAAFSTGIRAANAPRIAGRVADRFSVLKHGAGGLAALLFLDRLHAGVLVEYSGGLAPIDLVDEFSLHCLTRIIHRRERCAGPARNPKDIDRGCRGWARMGKKRMPVPRPTFLLCFLPPIRVISVIRGSTIIPVAPLCRKEVCKKNKN